LEPDADSICQKKGADRRNSNTCPDREADGSIVIHLDSLSNSESDNHENRTYPHEYWLHANSRFEFLLDALFPFLLGYHALLFQGVS
jgi:hypothetical protein